MVTFLRPSVEDFDIFSGLLEDFGTNFCKCSARLICSSVEIAQLVDCELGCKVQPFPLRYMGLPLSLRKLSARPLQHMVDNVADSLPACWG